MLRQNWSKMDGLGAAIAPALIRLAQRWCKRRCSRLPQVSPTRELAYQIFQDAASIGSQTFRIALQHRVPKGLDKRGPAARDIGRLYCWWPISGRGGTR